MKKQVLKTENNCEFESEVVFWKKLIRTSAQKKIKLFLRKPKQKSVHFSQHHFFTYQHCYYLIVIMGHPYLNRDSTSAVEYTCIPTVIFCVAGAMMVFVLLGSDALSGPLWLDGRCHIVAYGLCAVSQSTGCVRVE